MNIFGFAGLMRMLYGKKLPNLSKIQKKGLLAVKIAQHFALRVDFLDEKVCHHLTKLYRSTDPVKGETATTLLQKHLTKEWLQHFSHIEETPFASASIGQIHKAMLTDGRKVIIKIIREDFKKQFLKDIINLEKSLNILLFFMPKLKKVFDPLAILAHIKEYTLTELNLQNEIKGKETLLAIRENYKNRYNLDSLYFPTFHNELSSESILVADYIVGKTFDELLQSSLLPYEQLLELFSLHGLFLFGAGTFHGDMHPGNVILSEDKKLHFVDTGALSSINNNIKKGLFRFFAELTSNNFTAAAECIHSMSDRKISTKAYKRFEDEFQRLYKDFPNKSVSQISLTRKMMETIKLGVNRGMAFDKGMFPIIKSLMYLDGMVLRCNPDALLLNDMKPYIHDFKHVLER